jgi:MFS family permease
LYGQGRAEVPTSRVAAVIGANVTFATGLFFHAFLYNFYLEALGHPETVMGHAAAALTLGGLVALLPAGVVTDRLGIRASLVAAAAIVSVGLAAGAVVETPMPIYLAAAVAGVGGGAWRVAAPPTLMRLAPPWLRPQAFAWNVGLLVAAGGLGQALAGYIPDWFEATFQVTRLAALRAALLLGAAGSAVSIAVFAMLPGLPAAVSVPAASRGTADARRALSRTMLPLVLLVGVWMLGPALAAPFLNIFFTRRFALPVAQVGVVFAAAHLLWGAAVFASGTIAGRAGVLRFFATALAAFAPAMLGLSLASGLTLAVTLYILQGLVSPLTNPLIDQLLLARAPPERHGLVSSWRNAAADLSALAGASAGGIVLAHTSFAALFLVAGGVGLVGAAGLVLGLWASPHERPATTAATSSSLPEGDAAAAP